jgi:hypothetical protein
MNLVKGKEMKQAQNREILSRLCDMTRATLSKDFPRTERIIKSCELLSKMLNEEEHLPIMMECGMDAKRAETEFSKVKRMLSREYLFRKVQAELGETQIREFHAPFEAHTVREEIRPLGVLLHIAAGNAEGLPFLSVVEGLLAGNVNILKLPGIDDGLSTVLLKTLIEIDPELAEYIYVFNCPSDDVYAMQQMADAADGIVVWGGDPAVRAVRRLAGENVRIIEWGHKESFAYITGEGFKEHSSLTELAHNICSTEQLLCSSCQGIYVDTDSMDDVYAFCKHFINILQTVSKQYPRAESAEARAAVTLKLRNLEVESAFDLKRVYKAEGCSLTAIKDSKVEPTLAFRNCWVKPLPRREVLKILRAEKNHLQTMALLCAREERTELEELMCKAGFVRITDPEYMSTLYAGAPHDGEYGLRRYTKIVSFE